MMAVSSKLVLVKELDQMARSTVSRGWAWLRPKLAFQVIPLVGTSMPRVENGITRCACQRLLVESTRVSPAQSPFHVGSSFPKRGSSGSAMWPLTASYFEVAFAP